MEAVSGRRPPVDRADVAGADGATIASYRQLARNARTVPSVSGSKPPPNGFSSDQPQDELFFSHQIRV
jgi:hypothetical protein